MERREAEFERLVVIMAALAAGDGAAVVWLFDEFGVRIRAAVRRHLDRLNVRPDVELLHDLTVGAVLELQNCAGGWRPDGNALPWVWAERRLYKMVSDRIGQHHDSLDTTRTEVAAPHFGAPTPAVDESEVVVLRRMAMTSPQAALLQQALEVATTRGGIPTTTASDVASPRNSRRRATRRRCWPRPSSPCGECCAWTRSSSPPRSASVSTT